MRVTIDLARCQGHGRCYELSPEVFAADEQGASTVLDGPWTAQRAAAANIGALNCPENAITVSEPEVDAS